MAECVACGDGHYLRTNGTFRRTTLCFVCTRDWFEWMIRQGVANGNPLIACFWRDQPAVWIQSDYGDEYTRTPHGLQGFKMVVDEKYTESLNSS